MSIADLSPLGQLVVDENGRTRLELRKVCHGHANCCTCCANKPAKVIPLPIRQPWQAKRAA